MKFENDSLRLMCEQRPGTGYQGCDTDSENGGRKNHLFLSLSVSAEFKNEFADTHQR